MLTITRKLEFDAGHRIPDHRSQCRNLHGHRYVLEITLQGDLVDTEGAPDRGMVMDFADVKALAMEHLVNKWDHAFIVYEGDVKVREFLQTLSDHKTVVLDQDLQNASILVVDEESGDEAPRTINAQGANLQLAPFAVAVLSLK